MHMDSRYDALEHEKVQREADMAMSSTTGSVLRKLAL